MYEYKYKHIERHWLGQFEKPNGLLRNQLFNITFLLHYNDVI